MPRRYYRYASYVLPVCLVCTAGMPRRYYLYASYVLPVCLVCTTGMPQVLWVCLIGTSGMPRRYYRNVLYIIYLSTHHCIEQHLAKPSQEAELTAACMHAGGVS